MQLNFFVALGADFQRLAGLSDPAGRGTALISLNQDGEVIRENSRLASDRHNPASTPSPRRQAQAASLPASAPAPLKLRAGEAKLVPREPFASAPTLRAQATALARATPQGGVDIGQRRFDAGLDVTTQTTLDITV